MAEENTIPVVIRTQVYLDDPEYFCNKSWTLSFNVNTKSWVSFHSYIPNWYIAENNFFYSGINGCCEEFDFIAGPLVATPSTTTTTTMFVPTTTTTSTTVTSICAVIGVARATDCTLEGVGIITVAPTTTTTICQRPSNFLTEFAFIKGYTLGTDPEVVFTASQIEACAAVPSIEYVLSPLNTNGSTLDIFDGYANTTSEVLQLGNIVYYGDGTDCTLVPNGWYFTYSPFSLDNVYQISGGVVVTITTCNPTTTTTTTAIPCYSFTVTKTSVGIVTVNYIDCSGNPATIDVGLAEGGFSTQTFCARSVTTPTPTGVSLTNNGLC